jgi:hypothetical protein
LRWTVPCAPASAAGLLLAPAGSPTDGLQLRPPPASSAPFASTFLPGSAADFHLPCASATVLQRRRRRAPGRARGQVEGILAGPTEGHHNPRREEPQTKRAKLPFSAASRRFYSRERDSREEVKRFVGEAVFLTPSAQLCQKQLLKLLLKLCQRDP